jgi:hypothetical protein
MLQPILIVGMARSGTTLVSHILGSLPNVHMEAEPHALWKSGNFNYLNDEEYKITDKKVNYIRNKLTQNLKGKNLIEKSPVNCLRPNLVHSVFPDAKIIYIERDPVRCIYSNYSRSLKNDSFKLSIILKKYFSHTGSKDLSGAISERKLFQQISMADVPAFITYTAKMFYLRQVKNLLPFGPKLKNFAGIVKEKGLLYYHAEVYKASLRYKKIYKDLYGPNMQEFRMENIMQDAGEIRKMLAFINFEVDENIINEIQKTFDQERIESATKNQSIDAEINELINVSVN